MPYNLRKIVVLTFLFLSFSFRVSAPVRDAIIIFHSQPVEPFKKLILATGLVESKGDTLAYNPIEEAVGYFQIRPIRLQDYNNRTGSKYKMTDMFDYYISEKIYLYYAGKESPYDLEKIARNWNGSGSMTDSYWKSIKKLL
jgi:hypothetical protein